MKKILAFVLVSSVFAHYGYEHPDKAPIIIGLISAYGWALYAMGKI